MDNLPSFDNLFWLSLVQKVIADKALIALLEASPNLLVLVFEGFAQFFPAEEEEDVDGEDNHNNEDEGEDDHNDEDESEDNHNNEDETDLSEGEDDDNEDECWALDMVATRCSFLQRLMLVLFKKFTGNARELRWLKLIFKNAKDLKVVDISSDSVSHGKSNSVMADISSFPRASASGVLTLSSKQGSEVKVFSW